VKKGCLFHPEFHFLDDGRAAQHTYPVFAGIEQERGRAARRPAALAIVYLNGKVTTPNHSFVQPEWDLLDFAGNVRIDIIDGVRRRRKYQAVLRTIGRAGRIFAPEVVPARAREIRPRGPALVRARALQRQRLVWRQ
jgi:hypothetical protein